MNISATPEMTVDDISPFIMVFMFVNLITIVLFTVYIIYAVLRIIFTLISSYISPKEKGDFNLQGNIPDTSEV